MEKYSPIVVTGDRPTGKLHIGHYVGSLKNRLLLQNNHEMYILIADTQVLNNDITKAKKVKENILAIMKDYLAVGLNPKKVKIFLQSEIKELFELTNYLSNIVTLPQIQRIPTIKHENELYNSNMNIGFLNYPISQTADIILLDGEIVPVGVDQLPILEFSNDIIEKFHYTFQSNIFKKIKPLLSETSKLVGIDGYQKMAKSLNNAIFLDDNEKIVREKVFQMFTDSNHIKISDPGKIEGNVVFKFLDVFHQDKEELNNFKIHYQKGGLGDVYLKNILTKDINNVLNPIRENREKYSEQELMDILKEGTNFIQKKAKNKMEMIKEIIFK